MLRSFQPKGKCRRSKNFVKKKNEGKELRNCAKRQKTCARNEVGKSGMCGRAGGWVCVGVCVSFHAQFYLSLCVYAHVCMYLCVLAPCAFVFPPDGAQRLHS